MHSATLARPDDIEGWREAARALALAGIAPRAVDWRVGGREGLFAASGSPLPAPEAGGAELRVPRAFVGLAETVICHRDPGRFALLYRLLVRLRREPELLAVATDPDVARALAMARSVRRDRHKMTAFVRFREMPAGAGSRRRFAAWFEPDHHILRLAAPFFAGRFADMDWAILTPKGAILHENGRWTVSDEPAARPDLDDDTQALWETYFAATFNPARLKVKAMQAEMPKKYWRNLPEAALIPGLVAGARGRVETMAAQERRDPPAFHRRLAARAATAAGGAAVLPADTLSRLRMDAAACTRCPLHCAATQTVFGEGPEGAALMIVGEQPGDHEDLAGRPFVGPAGRVLDEALANAGIDRRDAYLTNAVKHFKHALRGKRRLHRTPDAGEVRLCRWWLTREIETVRPRLVVALGATALLALTGRKERLSALRSRIGPYAPGTALLVTVHPAYLLRIPDPAEAAAQRRRFEADLALARKWLDGARG